ncbi:MAG TPA: DUF6223 family protein [Gammaproteobacteria bacterium]
MTPRSKKDRAGNSGQRRVSRATLAWTAAVAGWAISVAPAADAYVGPGAGMGLVGIMLAFVAAILMGIVGLVLWPIRMVTHRRKSKREKSQEARDGGGREAPREPAPR